MDQLTLEQRIENNICNTYLYYKGIIIGSLYDTLQGQYTSVEHFVDFVYKKETTITDRINIVDAFLEGRIFDYAMNLTFKQLFTQYYDLIRIAFNNKEKSMLIINDLVIKQYPSYDEFTYKDKTVQYKFGKCLSGSKCVCGICNEKIKHYFISSTKSARKI